MIDSGLEDFQDSENDDEKPLNIIDDSIVTKLQLQFRDAYQLNHKVDDFQSS